jgi:hypothetical protein
MNVELIFLIINNLFDNGLLNWLRHYIIHYLILNFDTSHVHIGTCHINLRKKLLSNFDTCGLGISEDIA